MGHVFAPVQDETPLDDPMARLLANRVYGNDGPLPRTIITNDTLTAAWLEGVRDGGGAASHDANNMLNAIDEYGQIQIWDPVGNERPLAQSANTQ